MSRAARDDRSQVKEEPHVARRAIVPVILILFSFALSGQSWADIGVGPRLGVSFDPDQAHVGFHLAFGEFFPGWAFQPNLEIGAGSDATVVALNLEALYRFPEAVSDLRGYVGMGLGINFVDADNRQLYALREDADRWYNEDDTNLGFNVLIGFEKKVPVGDLFFGELKLGLADSPDAKITFGWTFYGPFSK
jgi:hypothetical protein